MKETAGSNFGLALSALLRCLGTASASASRTIRRCTPNFCATPLMVPTPNWYSRRIDSNNSTSFLLFKTASPFRAFAQNRIAVACFYRGPDQTIKVGQFRISKWANLQYRSGPIQSIEITRLFHAVHGAYHTEVSDPGNREWRDPIWLRTPCFWVRWRPMERRLRKVRTSSLDRSRIRGLLRTEIV